MFHWLLYLVAGALAFAWCVVSLFIVVCAIGALFGYVRPLDEGPGRYVPFRMHKGEWK